MNYDNMTAAVPCTGTCVKPEEVPLAQTLKFVQIRNANFVNLKDGADVNYWNGYNSQ